MLNSIPRKSSLHAQRWRDEGFPSLKYGDWKYVRGATVTNEPLKLASGTDETNIDPTSNNLETSLVSRDGLHKPETGAKAVTVMATGEPNLSIPPTLLSKGTSAGESREKEMKVETAYTSNPVKQNLESPWKSDTSVRKLTNTTVRGGRYRWYATNTGVGSVGSAVAMVR
jgi:hypothetical protein